MEGKMEYVIYFFESALISLFWIKFVRPVMWAHPIEAVGGFEITKK